MADSPDKLFPDDADEKYLVKAKSGEAITADNWMLLQARLKLFAGDLVAVPMQQIATLGESVRKHTETLGKIGSVEQPVGNAARAGVAGALVDASGTLNAEGIRQLIRNVSAGVAAARTRVHVYIPNSALRNGLSIAHDLFAIPSIEVFALHPFENKKRRMHVLVHDRLPLTGANRSPKHRNHLTVALDGEAMRSMGTTGALGTMTLHQFLQCTFGLALPGQPSSSLIIDYSLAEVAPQTETVDAIQASGRWARIDVTMEVEPLRIRRKRFWDDFPLCGSSYIDVWAQNDREVGIVSWQFDGLPGVLLVLKA